VAEKVGEKVQEVGKAASESTGVSEAGLSLAVKLIFGAIIVGGCFAWIRAHTASRGAVRNGAYEKVGGV
jgi:hypothetical protein